MIIRYVPAPFSPPPTWAVQARLRALAAERRRQEQRALWLAGQLRLLAPVQHSRDHMILACDLMRLRQAALQRALELRHMEEEWCVGPPISAVDRPTTA